MSKLGQVVESVEKYNQFVLDQVQRARTDRKFGRDLLGRWNDIKAKIPTTRAPTGLPLPRLALPEIDEPGEIAHFLFGEGLPGEFLRVDDDQRSGANHHGDVHRSGETPFRAERYSKTSRHDPGRYF